MQLLFIVVAVAVLALWIYALISAIRNERLTDTMRIVWVIVIVFVNGLGALLYLIFAPNRPSQNDRVAADWQRRLADQHRRAGS